MYQVSDRPCPLCFRLLRIKPKDKGLYCPDQLYCCWKTNDIKIQGRRLTLLPTSYLREELHKAQTNHDQIREQRIRGILSRR